MQEVPIESALPWWLHPTLVTMIATITIAIATLANIVVSYRAGRAAKRSADAADRAAKTAEDASVVTKAAFESGHRPYWAVSKVEAVDLDDQEKETPPANRTPHREHSE